MSEEKRENVSAMVDGELASDSQAVIDDLLQTPQLRDCWARYHLISDTLRQNLPEAIESGIAARISRCIEGEPAILAPKRSFTHSFLKPVAGMAIAASVAAMAILGIQYEQKDPGNPEQQTVVFAAPQASSSITPTQVASNSPTEEHLRQVKADARARLNSYLVNYNEYRTNSGFQGMLPYVRTVTYENNK